jgi:cold shock CspA family protein
VLRGKVKWFSNEKGFGFITHSGGSNHTDYYFHISSVIGPDAPNQGDVVEFQEGETKKGKAASDVRILEKSQSYSSSSPKSDKGSEREPRSASRDDRVECKHCGKRMVPRIQFSKGNPVARLCPFCMKSQEKGCFIATAAFNGDHHVTVNTLRHFRDHFLLRSKLGRYFVSTYYFTSPFLAKWIEYNPSSKAPIRWVLTRLANTLRLITK